MTNLLLALSLSTNWTYVGQFTPVQGPPQEVRRGQIVTNIHLAIQWNGEPKLLPLEQKLGPVIGEYLFMLNSPLPIHGDLNPVARPFPKGPKQPAPEPPSPPPAVVKKSTNTVIKGITPRSIAPGTVIPGYPKFTVLTNAAKSANVVLPPMHIENQRRYVNIDNNLPIFSADAMGMKVGSNYVIESNQRLDPVWSRYYGPFQWLDPNPETYLRFEDVISEMPCVPYSPSGATICIPTERYWRIRQVP